MGLGKIGDILDLNFVFVSDSRVLVVTDTVPDRGLGGINIAPGACKKTTINQYNSRRIASYFRRILVSSGLHRLRSRREIWIRHLGNYVDLISTFSGRSDILIASTFLLVIR